METLGEDILLLAVWQNGSIAVAGKIRFALAGSELVRLAVLRRVEVVEGRIIVIDPRPTGDPLLDAALANMRGFKRPPQAKKWVARNRGRLTEAYLQRLVDSGAVRLEVGKVLGLFRVKSWHLVDTARSTRLRAQLDQIAHSTGPAVDSQAAAFGGLVYAIGLGSVLYPKREGRPARKRLEWIAKHRESAAVGAVRGAVQAAEAAQHSSIDAANQASVNAATDAAMHAAIDASVHAATEAAVQASVSAAVSASIDAAVSASVEAAHHSAGDGGGGGHHH